MNDSNLLDLTPQEIMKQIRERIQAAHDTHTIGCYVHRGTLGIEEVRCKCCGDPVRKLIPHEDFSETRIVDGRPVIVQRLMLGTLPNYTEIRIEFDDGSRHVTLACDCCAGKFTLDDLEWLYCYDLAEWLTDGDHASVGFWIQQLKRKPTDFVVYPPGMVAM